MLSEQELAIQYGAAKHGAVLFDLPGWTVLRLIGHDCVNFLHNFCTADIKGLAPGTGREAFLTNVKARVIGHALVFADEDTTRMKLSLITSPGQAARLIPHLDRYVITEDVVLEDQSQAVNLVYVVGPTAKQSLSNAGVVLPDDANDPHLFTSRVQNGLTARRADILGLPGIFLELAAGQTESLFRSRLAACGVEPAAPEILELLRIEAGFPLYEADITEDHLAPEVDRPWAISYTKGCYLGQEPIARIDALGHVNRELRGISIDADSLPEQGATVMVDGREIGVVTSAAKRYSEQGVVALGYLKTRHAQPGVEVVIRTPLGDLTGTVVRAR